MTHNENGSATLHTLFAVVLLMTALAAATLWSTISTARHKLATAADLTALSAAQSLTTAEPFTAPPQPKPANQPTTVTDRAIATDSASVRGPASVAGPAGVGEPGASPCAVAARVADLHKVSLIACNPTATSVTVQVSLEVDLSFTHATLTATSRAGPV